MAVTQGAGDKGNSGNFDVRNPEIENILRKLGHSIEDKLPKGWGFALNIFEYGTPNNPGSNFYISSADRQDVIRMLKEFIAREERPQERN